MSEQLAQSCDLTVERPRVEPRPLGRKPNSLTDTLKVPGHAAYVVCFVKNRYVV